MPIAVVAPGGDRDLELGADAIGGGDQHRIAIARCLEIEQAAEAAELGIGARAAVARASGAIALTSAFPAAIETPASA